MSLQDILFDGLNTLQSDGDLRGAFQHIINSGTGGPLNQGWHPTVDIVDTPNNLYVYLELPGVSEDSIGIDFFNNRVSVSGEKLKRYTSPATKREIVYGKFNRKITLPLSVTNQENVIVKYSNGVLTLTIDKKKEARNRFRMSVTNNLNTDPDQEEKVGDVDKLD